MELKQECLCSLGLAEECPAHPFRERRVRPKPNSEEIRKSDCPACVVIGVKEHVSNRHKLGGYAEVSKALTIGIVYVKLKKFEEAGPMVVRNAKSDGGLQIEILEGWQSGPFEEIWMEVKTPAKIRATA